MSETLSYASSCPGTGTLISGSRVYYDGTTTLGQAPMKGNPTRTDTAVTATEWARSTTAFDTAGRVTSSTVYTSGSDTVGRTTTLSYTPVSGGPVTQVKETNPLGHATTTVYTIDGQPSKITQPGRAGHRSYL